MKHPFYKKTSVIRSSKPVYLLLIATFLMGCQNTSSIQPGKGQATQESSRLHQDSTVYFAKKTASISMRASFDSTVNSNENNKQSLITQSLVNGYKIQFRTIKKPNTAVSQISIIAGGKKIVIADGTILIPHKRGITLSLSLKDSIAISQQADAVLRFKYNNESLLMTIKNHKISEFTL